MSHIIIAFVWLSIWKLIVSEWISLSESEAELSNYKGKYYKAFNAINFIVYIPIFDFVFSYTYDFPSLIELAKRILTIILVEAASYGIYLFFNRNTADINNKSVTKIFEYKVTLFLVTLYVESIYQATFYYPIVLMLKNPIYCILIIGFISSCSIICLKI